MSKQKTIDPAKDLTRAGIYLTTNSAGFEHPRYGKDHHQRRDRFEDLIRQTFLLPASTAGAKSAHLLAFHLILPIKIPAALGATPYSFGGSAYIDYSWEKDAPLERRELSVFTRNAFASMACDTKAEWSAFVAWLKTVPGYKLLKDENLVGELTADMLAWAIGNVPYPLWAHVSGVRPIHPVPMSTLARLESGQALIMEMAEAAIEREIGVADLLDAAVSRPLEADKAPSQRDIDLIDDAAKLLRTARNEKPEETLDRWVRALLNLQPRVEVAAFSCALVLSWMTDLAESGTSPDTEIRHYTRRRYIVCGASPIYLKAHAVGTHPSAWNEDVVNTMCLELMEDRSIKDKVGLGGAISSYFKFLHLNFGTPLPRRGIHRLIPEPVPRAQFVSETEIKRAIGWVGSYSDADPQLMAIARVALAMGWAAPFRLQELLNLEMRNVAAHDDGGFEIEILPKGWHVPLKTPAAHRRVRITNGWAADALREFFDMRWGQGATGRSKLFANEVNPDAVYRTFALQALLLRLLKAATGDPVMTFHALRHSWASVRIAQVLASCSIANFNRLAHIAAELGHVSAVSTLLFYSHFAEAALNCHLSATIREVIEMGNGTAELHFNEKSNSVLQRWLRKYAWNAEQCMWHEMQLRADRFDCPSVTASCELVDPDRPTVAKAVVHPFHPMTVLRVLGSLKLSRGTHKQIANWHHLSEADVALIRESALEIAGEWLGYSRKARQSVVQILSVDGALSALYLDLHAAERTKYQELKAGLSVPLVVPPAFRESWMKTRSIVRLPKPQAYFFLYPTSDVSPMLDLLKSAGVGVNQLAVRVPAKADSNQSVALETSEVAFLFQGVWNRIPGFRPVAFHPARSRPYLTFPGKDVPAGEDASVHAEVGGLDALLFACAVYSLSLEKKHVAASH